MNLLKTWSVLNKIPFGVGKRLFSRMLGGRIPYTGTIQANVEVLKTGYCQISMRDRRGIRNHLNSIHAVALMNLAEFCSGLGFVASAPNTARTILVEFQFEFLKKARGKITAQTQFTPLEQVVEDQDITLEVFLYNSNKECVAQGKAKWRVGPKKS